MPSGAQNGWIAWATKDCDPLLGKGCTNTDKSITEPVVYDTQRPSGEKEAAGGIADSTPPNGAAFLSCTENVSSVFVEAFVAAKRNRLPSGDHDSGMCTVSLSGLVSRSAVPLPSASCQKIARSPSRSDWKAMR